jgi:hypothetical protein
MERVFGLCLITTVGWVLTCGSAGYCGHGHSSHSSTHAASTHPKPSHPAPKHSGGKPNNPKSEAKPKPHETHKSGPAKPTAKPQAAHPKERGSNTMAGGPKSNDKTHDHDHHHEHEHHHDHHHGHGDHVWVGGVEVDGATVTDGSVGGVAPVDGTVAPAMIVPDGAAPVASLGRQILFSVGPQERDAYDAAARAAGMSRADWIRSRLNAAIQQESK